MYINLNDNIKFIDDLLKLKIRRVIYAFILKNPGMHLCELVRKLNIPRSTLSYHLNYLEKQRLIITEKSDKYNRYIISENIGSDEKKILKIIRLKTTRNVLLGIMVSGIATQEGMAKESGLKPATINFHLKRLLKYDIIEKAPKENGIIYTKLESVPIVERKKCKNDVFYRLKEPKTIEKLLIMYYNKGYYDGDIIADIIIYFGEELTKNAPSKKIRTAEEGTDLFEKIILDIFPHPYHA